MHALGEVPRECRVPPGVLSSMTQLQHLHLVYCALLPGELDVEPTAVLLDVLPQFTRLQHLHIEGGNLDTGDIAPERFSALTASSQLTHLVIGPEDVSPLPLHAVQHMFPAGRRMPQLRYLGTSPDLNALDEDSPDLSCMDSGDLASIFRCCPELQHLDITCAVQPGADLSVLAQLPESCTSLLVGGATFTDAAAPVLARLTQLEYLCCSYSPGFTDAGLEQLTALDLGRLYVYDSGLSDEITPEGDPGTLDLEWGGNVGGSVSKQIDALCARSPVCAPARAQRSAQGQQ